MHVPEAVIDYGVKYKVSIDDSGMTVRVDQGAANVLFIDQDSFKDLTRLAEFVWGKDYP